jgi:site-specific DNA-methyltransferase (adenine-specific)
MKLTPTPLTIPLDQIEVGERFRRELGDIAMLAHDITERGLISPVAVVAAQNFTGPRETDRPYILLAGGRRMAALKHLREESVSTHAYTQDLTELDLRTIELAENLMRKDMTYAEDIALKDEIHRLQILKHGQKVSKSPNAPGWSQKDTAELLGESTANVSDDFKLAKAIKEFPELQLDRCKNKNEARKKLLKVQKTFTNQMQAEKYTETMKDSRTFDKLSNAYIVGDFFNLAKSIPSGSMDLVELDPPYGIDLPNVKAANDCEGYNEIPSSEYMDFIDKVFAEAFRVLRHDGWFLCWFGPEPWFEPLFQALKKHRFIVKRMAGIWIKPTGQTNAPNTNLANSYEMFFYARKDDGVLQKPGRSNVFVHPPVHPSNKTHPTERPIELMREVLSTFARPGSNILVPCLGSGVTLLAAHDCRMKAIGTDLEKSYKDGYVLKLKEVLK